MPPMDHRRQIVDWQSSRNADQQVWPVSLGARHIPFVGVHVKSDSRGLLAYHADMKWLLVMSALSRIEPFVTGSSRPKARFFLEPLPRPSGAPTRHRCTPFSPSLRPTEGGGKARQCLLTYEAKLLSLSIGLTLGH